MINGKVDIQSSPDYGPENISVCFISKPARDTISLKNLNEDGSFRQSLSAGNYQIDFLDDKTRLLTKNVDIPAYLPHNTLVMHEQISIPESVISIKDTFRIRDIRFEFNKSSLNDQYIGFLDELAMLMAKYPDISLQLKGFTDALGSDKYNLSLSAQRAENVREFLSTRLGSSERIVINAMGEREPIALNKLNGADNPQGRSYNRRVEIIVLNVPDTLIIIKIKDIPESILAR
jgi:outer membrane protein OmpA-like peptidoglycan-associated protein